LKNRQKLREKEAKAKAKEEEKKAQAAAAPKKGGAAAEVELDPTQYTANRKALVQSIRDQGKNPYPHKFERTHRIDEFHKEFDAKITENGQFLEDQIVATTGRVLSIREAG
jgi:lysyl-tRNA synthetase class 2